MTQTKTKAAEYAIEWWNLYSEFEERLELCKALDWLPDRAEGEASLEWLTQEEIDELLGVSYATLIDIEKGVPQ